MHPYATDESARRFVYPVLAAVAIVFAWLLHVALVALSRTVPWWIDAPSVLGFFGIFVRFTDRAIWKTRLLRSLGVPPDLSGVWAAKGVSDFRGESRTTLGNVKIEQTWSRLRISIDWDESRSWSTAATLLLDQSGATQLVYTYMNQPNAGSADTMHMHEGTVRLVLEEGLSVLRGEYYSGRDRRSVGTLEFRRA